MKYTLRFIVSIQYAKVILVHGSSMYPSNSRFNVIIDYVIILIGM